MSTFTKRAIDSLKEMMLWASTDENGEPISPERFDPQFAAAMARAESVLAEEDAAKEARRLVAAIDGVKAKLEWKPSGLGKWESRGANEYVDWRIRVDMQDGTFSVTRDEGGTVTKSGYPSLAEAKAYCQEQEDKAHG